MIDRYFLLYKIETDEVMLERGTDHEWGNADELVILTKANGEVELLLGASQPVSVLSHAAALIVDSISCARSGRAAYESGMSEDDQERLISMAAEACVSFDNNQPCAIVECDVDGVANHLGLSWIIDVGSL